MTCKPPPYNEKIHRIHHPNGVYLRLAHKMTGNVAWEGPVKKSLTLHGIAEKLRSGDEPISFYHEDKEIPSNRFGQCLKLLRNELAEQREGEPTEPTEPTVFELDFFCREGEDSGLLKAAAKGGIQSMENAIEAMKERMRPSDIRKWCTEAILVASKNGDPEKVQLLVTERADIEAKDKCGNTALLVAAGKGHQDAQLCLIKAGANIQVTNPQGKTVFLLAAERGNKGVVQCLLDSRVALEARDPEGHTALLLATRNSSLAMVSFLLSKNADVHATNHDCTTALQLAASGGYAAIITELVKWGAAVNGSDKYSLTSLDLAAQAGHASAVKVLLQERASLEHRGGADSSLLLALKGKNKEVVKLLLDGTADVNAWSQDGMTPILQVANSGQADLVDLLVQKRADLNAQVKGKGSTALQLAARRGHATTAERFKNQLEKLIVSPSQGDCSNIWQRKQHARQHARQVQKVEDEINSAVRIAQKKRHRDVIELLKPKEPMDRGSAALSP